LQLQVPAASRANSSGSSSSSSAGSGSSVGRQHSERQQLPKIQQHKMQALPPHWEQHSSIR
jgi:hypothetical protein